MEPQFPHFTLGSGVKGLSSPQYPCLASVETVYLQLIDRDGLIENITLMIQ